MPARTGFVATALAVYNATEHAQMPKGAIGYNFGGNGTTVTSAGIDLVSITVTVNADRLLQISCSGSIALAGSSNGGIINAMEGGTDFGRVHRHPDTIDESFAAGFVIVDGPSAGSHTYKLRGDTTTGAFDLYGNMTILVEDMGPSTALW